MSTNLFNKPGYIVLQYSAPRMSYPCERIIAITIIIFYPTEALHQRKYMVVKP